MKIKVNGFYQKKTMQSQQRKDGSGSYNIHNFYVITNLEGQSANINVRTFSDKSADSVIIGAELSLEPKSYQGFTYYVIEKPIYIDKSGFKGYSKPSYNIEEYDNLFRHAYALSTKMVDGLGDHIEKASFGDIFSRLLSTYIISATNAGVKVPIQQQQPLPPVEKVAETMGGQVVDNTPPNTTPMDENDIPF